MRRFKWHRILIILLLSTFLTTAVACDEMAIPEGATSSEGLPVINEFYADPQEALPADSATLHWNVSGASTVTIEPNVGAVALSGERGVNPIENTNYILTASNEVGSVTASTEVIGSSYIAGVVEGSPPEEMPPGLKQEASEPTSPTKPSVLDPKTPKSTLKPTEESGSIEPKSTDSPLNLTYEPSSPQLKVLLPIIHSFRADPESIYVDSPTKLRWEVSNADTVAITALGFNKMGLPSTGSTIVSPNNTTEYTLEAINSTGSHIQRVIVTVIEQKTMKVIPSLEPVGLPVILYFRANPESVPVGDTSTISWKVSDADTINIHFLSDSMQVDSSGSIQLKLNFPITFTLVATNGVGTRNATVTITPGPLRALVPTVEPVGLPTINYFRANPIGIVAGDSSWLSWEVSDADSTAIYYSAVDSFKVDSSGSIEVEPSTTHTYTLTADNSIGTRSATVTVNVLPPGTIKPLLPNIEPAFPPTIHEFNAEPKIITLGALSRLTWEVSGADSVYIGTTKVESSGSSYTKPSETTDYMLFAINGAGWVSNYVTVTVTPPGTVKPMLPPKLEPVAPPIIHYFYAEPESITSGSSSRLSWEVSNVDSVNIYSDNFRRESLPLVGSINVSPATTSQYQLSAVNDSGGMIQYVTVAVELLTPIPLPPVEVAKPDLVITDIWRSGSTQWHYLVKNQGNVKCKESISTLMIDGKNQVSQSIGPLAAGQSKEFFFSYKYSCGIGTSHTWTVVADDKGYIAESEEGNNSRTEKFTCP